MTEAERKYMEHLWRCLKWFGADGTMECARRFAKTDPYQLSRLPDLLQEEINKHRATKKETT